MAAAMMDKVLNLAANCEIRENGVALKQGFDIPVERGDRDNISHVSPPSPATQ